jgi:cellulose synthase operon protein C
MEKITSRFSLVMWIAAACVLAPNLHLPLLAQTTAEKVLLARAASMAQSGRLDIAVQTWQQVLLSDPTNREALRGAAKAEMQLGRTEEAKAYLDRLRAIEGTSSDVSSIEAMPRVQPQSVRLNQASKLAQDGRYADAMKIYRDIYGNDPPAGNTALSYYDTEAAIPADRAHAIAGLRRLSTQFPADTRYAITLGRILTYDTKTRPEGIAILQKYESSAQAQAALAQANKWNTMGAQQAGSAAAAKPSAGEAAVPSEKPPANSPESDAYRALNAGKLPDAEKRFAALLQAQPNNPSALAGMGYVRMKQGNFAEAADYLTRARQAGAAGKGLEDALATAHFWNQMNVGNETLKAGDLKAAEAAYRKALESNPSNPDAAEALAGTLLQLKDTSAAITIYENELRTSPSREAAWRGLILAQVADGDSSAAVATSRRVPKAIDARLQRDPGYLLALAKAYTAAGQKAEADRVLQTALALPFPKQARDLPVDQQIQFASLLMMARRYEPAMQLYRQILAAEPDNGGAWMAMVSALHELHRDEDALTSIRRMPQPAYQAGMKDVGFLSLVAAIYQSLGSRDKAQTYIERALAINPDQPDLQMQLASIYLSGGSSEKAYAIYRGAVERNAKNAEAWSGLVSALHQSDRDPEALQQAASMPDSVRIKLERDPGFLQTLASIQSATGQQRSALRTFDQVEQLYSDRHMEPPVDVQIQYGWLLLKASDDRKLYGLVAQLSRVEDMTDEQRNAFYSLWASWSVSRANAALKGGNTRLAISILETAARAFPQNPEIYQALAGAYLKDGQAKRAVSVYALMDMNAATLGQYQGAVGAALMANDLKHAAPWLESALLRYKEDPTILKMAAQYEQARGDNRKAAAYYRAALEAMGPQPLEDILTNGGRTNALPQPGSQPSPTQDLMRLLAPEKHVSQGSRQTSSPDTIGQDNWAPVQQQRGQTLGEFSSNDSYSLPPIETPRMAEYEQPRIRIVPSASPLPEVQTRPQEVDDAEDLPPIIPTHPLNSRHAQTRTAAITTSNEGQTLGSVSSDDFFAPEIEPNVNAAQSAPPTAPPPIRYAEEPPAEHESSAGKLQNAVSLLTPHPALLPSTSSTSGVNSLAHAQAVPLQAPIVTPPEPQSPNYGSSQTTNAVGNSQSYGPNSNFVKTLPPLRGSSMEQTKVAKTPREEIEDQLASIEAGSTPWIGNTTGITYRSGQPGYDRLSIYSSQIEESSLMGPGARFTAIQRPVLLDSGTANGTSTSLQGTLPAGSVPYFQSASGIGGDVQLRTSAFAASLGYTPWGFLVSNVTGSFYLHPASSHLTLTLDRDAIKETQLSYAGLRDLGSTTPTYPGNIWGGVVTNGGRIQATMGDAKSGWYLEGGGQYLTGNNVPSNTRIDGDAGAYWAAWHDPAYGSLTIGMNFFGMHYDKNLRYFTYGQGGYFSPSAYLLGGVPLTFNGHYGPKFHYRALMSLGVQAFQESSSPFYPTDPALQASRGNPYYPERTSVGGNYNFEGEGSYAIADHWYVGGFLAFNNTLDYASDRIGFYFRYTFRPQVPSESSSTTGIFPAQGLRPLLVP